MYLALDMACLCRLPSFSVTLLAFNYRFLGIKYLTYTLGNSKMIEVKEHYFFVLPVISLDQGSIYIMLYVKLAINYHIYTAYTSVTHLFIADNAVHTIEPHSIFFYRSCCITSTSKESYINYCIIDKSLLNNNL